MNLQGKSDYSVCCTGVQPTIAAPRQVDGRRATRRQVLAALPRSARAMERLFAYGLERGKLPSFSLDMVHFVTYHAMHEAHHRGQLCTVARQLGYRLPDSVLAGLWEWNKRAKEV